MSDQPRVTIGIPTQGKRPERLQLAIESALAQQRPARVLISDQGGEARDAIKPFLLNPLVSYHTSPATCLWENWSHAAACCESEYFAWLQDDDVVSSAFALRIERAFAAFPDAIVWLARLGISYIPGMANWWQATGPMVPMDLRRGLPVKIPASLIQSASYFNSWALSPAVAFRVSPEAIAAVKRVPNDADLFAERIVLAELCTLGNAICDPAYVGEWVHHEGNESAVQNRQGGASTQYLRVIESVDRVLEATPDWPVALKGWAAMVGVEPLAKWLEETKEHAEKSATLRKARAVLQDIVDAKPEPKPEPPKSRPFFAPVELRECH